MDNRVLGRRISTNTNSHSHIFICKCPQWHNQPGLLPCTSLNCSAVQVAARSAMLRTELDAAHQALAEVRQEAAAAEARAARLDAKAAQQQTV